jgi:hypothetical protein
MPVSLAVSDFYILLSSYKANPASIVTTVVNNDTGEEKKRLVNRMRWKGYGPTTIMFADTEVLTRSIPTRPFMFFQPYH